MTLENSIIVRKDEQNKYINLLLCVERQTYVSSERLISSQILTVKIILIHKVSRVNFCHLTPIDS